MMTIKPDNSRAFKNSFLFFALIIFLFNGILPYFFGKDVKLAQLIGMMIAGGTFLGFGVVVMFTPKEISWTNETFLIKARFFGSGEFSWKQLEAYSTFGKRYGTFLIKFNGHQTFQMVSFGFLPTEWNEFQNMLNARFPEKKTWLWLGPIPVRFG